MAMGNKEGKSQVISDVQKKNEFEPMQNGQVGGQAIGPIVGFGIEDSIYYKRMLRAGWRAGLCWAYADALRAGGDMM